MKVGIIVHSYTGNTLSVAKRLMDKLISDGNTVNLERVEAVNEDPKAAANVELKTIPDIGDYDVLIFGAPVNGFSLSAVMNKYLLQLPSLEGRKIGCFVTHFFPFEWMGGTRTIKQMKELCEAKGQSVFETGVVNWSSRKREKNILDVLEMFSKI